LDKPRLICQNSCLSHEIEITSYKTNKKIIQLNLSINWVLNDEILSNKLKNYQNNNLSKLGLTC